MGNVQSILLETCQVIIRINMIQRYQLCVSIAEKATNPENALLLVRSVRNVIRITLVKCVNRQRQRKMTPEQDWKRNPTKKIQQVVDVATKPDSDQDDFYSPTCAFKGVKQYMVQP